MAPLGCTRWHLKCLLCSLFASVRSSLGLPQSLSQLRSLPDRPVRVAFTTYLSARSVQSKGSSRESRPSPSGNWTKVLKSRSLIKSFSEFSGPTSVEIRRADEGPSDLVLTDQSHLDHQDGLGGAGGISITTIDSENKVFQSLIKRPRPSEIPSRTHRRAELERALI
jgi:hypothetical protein